MGKVNIEADIPQTVNYVATTINVGSTTTLPSGSDATVTNSGTESNAIFNFGIPKGADGVDGSDGKSAYEQAVEGGYQGTEEEFEAALASDIATVASNISDVNAVGQSISDVNTVSDNLTDISTVATNVSDVNTVAGISSDVTSVVSISSAVSTVASHDTEVLLVSDNMASVMTTASNIGDVSAVADNVTNINAVASDLTNIDTAATNIAAIIAAPTAATNAATSATNAQTWAEGTDADVSALGGTKSSKGWANRAEEIVAGIGTVLRYKGSVATYNDLPSTGNVAGDVWNVLSDGSNYAWTGTEWDDLSGVVDLSAYRTAAAQDTIDAGKQATLVSGTNIKTINSNSILGSGNISIDSLPSQTGNTGKFLTTDGSSASWATVNALPSQAGQSGKFLTTNGTSASWATVSIPTVNNATLTITQGGSTKGTFTANASSDVTIDIDAGGSVDIDSKSITANSSDEIQTVGVIDQNDTTKAIKTWTGTRQQYDAILSKDSDTLYTITDDAATGGMVFDNTLSSTSENAVQNKTLYAIIGDIETLINAL